MEEKITFTQTILIVTGISILISRFISLHCIFLFELNENQLLYLFTMKGQIVGGLFALTLTAYIFFADKLREIGLDENDYYDAALALRYKYFKDLIFIAGLVFLTILFCVIGISMINKFEIVFPFVLNQSLLLFFICVGSILYFGVTLLDPSKIDNKLKELGKKAEISFHIDPEDETVEMGTFLSAYNQLENTIIAQYNSLDFLYHNNNNNNKHKPQIIQALNALLQFEIITHKTSVEIHEIRMYRNKLVHSIDTSKIPVSICSRIKEIESEIEKNAQKKD